MSSSPLWLNEPALQQLFAAVRDAGGQLRVVGGAVRDWRMGRSGGDVDLASTLLPEKMMEVAAAHGWKAIPTGIDHGTVTLVLPSRVVEVTTLRRDVETDGRHATVAYTDNWQEDAARRDFTFNALSMEADGTLHDYFNGENDVTTHTVRFIGAPSTRIAEDGLRILRYFRFLATHGTAPADGQALAACEQKKEMLAALSGERIAQEMRKLLAAENPLYSLQHMEAIGLSSLLSNSPWQIAPLEKLLQLEAQHALVPHGWVRLMALLPPAMRITQAEWIAERWRLSRAERSMLDYLAIPAAALTVAEVKELLRHAPREWVRDRAVLDALDHEASEGLAEKLTLIHSWAVPVLPVTAKDLLALGLKEGPLLGQALRTLETTWVARDYTLDKDALLAGFKA